MAISPELLSNNVESWPNIVFLRICNFRKSNTSINTYYATGRQVNPGDSEILVCLKKSLKRQRYICIICLFQNKKYVYLSCDTVWWSRVSEITSSPIERMANCDISLNGNGHSQVDWAWLKKFRIGRYLIQFNKINWFNLSTRCKTTLAAGFQSLKCGDCSAC